MTKISFDLLYKIIQYGDVFAIFDVSEIPCIPVDKKCALLIGYAKTVNKPDWCNWVARVYERDNEYFVETVVPEFEKVRKDAKLLAEFEGGVKFGLDDVSDWSRIQNQEILSQVIHLSKKPKAEWTWDEKNFIERNIRALKVYDFAMKLERDECFAD